MTPAERLHAAVAKLEAQRAAEPYHESHGWLVDLVTVGTESNPWQEEAPLTSSELIVTLHRTIDAQLGVLRAGIENERVRRSSRLFSGSLATAAEALADAIIGAEQ